ncbi:MAG: hypothetical protein SFV32_09755 [Opitutaceae bacterium]|nr:hypothetical protein [Opitutaceae bacterium]
MFFVFALALLRAALAQFRQLLPVRRSRLGADADQRLRISNTLMAKSANILEWCIVRLGEDHNWWVDEVSDPVRWDVDGLSVVDPRQVAHIIELIEPLRDYGFDQDVFEAAFIPFRIEKDLGNGRVRIKRVKDTLFESEDKLFALPDVLDEENGPYADLLDHITRCRVKMLNDLFDFESKLTVDEVEDEIREDQNSSFIEGKAIHTFEELTAILEYVPAGWDTDEETTEKEIEEDEDDDIPELDEEEEEKLKNDESLKWDEEEESEEEEDGAPKPAGEEDEDEDSEDEEEEAEEEEDEDERPKRKKR